MEYSALNLLLLLSLGLSTPSGFAAGLCTTTYQAGAPAYATSIKGEKKIRKIGEGSSGNVYLYETTLPSGEKAQTVKKTLSLEKGETAQDLDVKVRAYELAAELEMGPRVVAAVPKKTLFAREPYVEISLEYAPGVSLVAADWPRNNLPESFERARSMYGGFVVIQKAWANTTKEDYAKLIKKADTIRNIHPDPTEHNIRFIEREVEGKAVLDVIAVDWEDSQPGKMARVVSELEGLRPQ